MSKSDDYIVGYKKPPKASQFKPGQSGNPKGRKKKPKTVWDAMILEFKKPISVKSNNGSVSRKLAYEVVAQVIINKLLKGDVALLKLFMNKNLLNTLIIEEMHPNKEQNENCQELATAIRKLLHES